MARDIAGRLSEQLEERVISLDPTVWQIGIVDNDAAYFEIRFGDFMGSDEPLIPLARVSHGTGDAFQIEILNLRTREQQQGLVTELHEYLVERAANKPDNGRFTNSWDYLTYHATQTAANLYGEFHWVLIDPSLPARVELDLTEAETGIWQKIKSLWVK